MNRLILMVVFIVLSCSYSKSFDFGDKAFKIMRSHSKQFEKRQNVKLKGIGGGMMYDLKQMSLSYSAVLEVDLQKARRMFIDGAEGLLAKVNADKQLRIYLHNYPFTEDNLKFSITFESNFDTWVSNDYIASVSLVKGDVGYYRYNHQMRRLELAHEEPYAEALRIVMEEKTVL